ncbi:retrovirus-related pol polyprotein from transposon TNT 1-94, partial [Tanacetum coccineum]
TDEELTEKEIKQMEADDQAVQTILMGLPEDIYAAVDSCETTKEIWLHVQQMMKGSDIWIQEKKAKLDSNLNANQNGNGNVVVARAKVRPRRRDAAYLQTQLLIAQKEEAGIQLQAEEFDLMAAARDLDEIEEVNANCILMANLKQASTSGVESTAKTRIPQPRSNTKNDRAPSASKSICIKNKDIEFLGSIRFGNDHIASILDFEVAFRRNTCFVRNLEGVDLLKGNHTTNLYTINLHGMASASLICLMARATSTKSWLWHQRLSHLNFNTINDLAKNDLVTGLPKFNIIKNIFVPHVSNEKAKRHLTHPNPFQIQSRVYDYSCYTWVHFLRSKDEAPEVIKTFLKRIIVLLQSPVIIIRTNYSIEFKNQIFKEYFDSVGISHQASSVRTPRQNRVVERRNQTLVEAARTMLIFSRASLFLWAEAIATACYTQNRSIIHRRFNKTSYELINGRKPDISFLHVFGALYYPKNDSEDIGKLGEKGDIGFFIGYSANSSMDFEQRSLKPELQSMTFGQINSGLNLTYASSTITTQQPTEHELDLLFEAMYDDYIDGQPSVAPRTIPAAQALQDVDELETQQHHVPNVMLNGNMFVNPFATPSTSAAESSSSQYVDPSNMHTFYEPYPHEYQWTKDHPLEQVIGEPSRPVLKRNQLRSDGDMCMYALTTNTIEPKNVKEAMTDPA